ncbi:MAG: exodeoxyribonuclease VII large subunit [gamma proteobacterium symbiont of Bathyaustriella thionipta]|nr:exodeoxyribonuclease VII large subunit [gamma proteobacterium symbiont of Bathyaustriella thionipta]
MPQADQFIYSVSQLNQQARSILEGSFPLIWIEGELSNLARPASGHWYFTLKDASAQVRCAMFRTRNRLLRFQPANGDRITLRARVSLYEGRGDFQLIAEHMQPAGLGDLQAEFEALKKKLALAGLFDKERKRPLPAYPRCVGVITSASGAAVQDIISVLKRRFAGLPVIVYPSSVQGESAVHELIRAIQVANQRAECDVLILARGGGSLEDLWAFNNEQLAYAIRDSQIPLVSAVGHESDFSIADFVADYRAPTPSAAAEQVCPDGMALSENLQRLQLRLHEAAKRLLQQKQQTLDHYSRTLRAHSPMQRLQQQMQQVDNLQYRLLSAQQKYLDACRNRLQQALRGLQQNSPGRQLSALAQTSQQLGKRLDYAMHQSLRQQQQALALLAGRMHSASPMATLQRGYAVVTDCKNKLISDSRQVKQGDCIQAQLAHGQLECVVTETKPAD